MDLREIVRQRRSIRKYEKREIPRDILNEVLEDALWAPSGTNRQNWQIVAVRGAQRDKLVRAVASAGEHMKPRLEKLFKEKMVKITLQFFKDLGGAPVVLLVYIPKTAVDIRPDMSSTERHYIEHQRFNNLSGAAALIQNILLLAKAKGLGTCWMTAPKYVEDEINEVMGVEEQELVAVIPIGYPDQDPPAPPRKGDKIRWVGFD